MANVYTQTYTSMTLCSLTQEWHERTCGYWYTVTTFGGTAHTAFRTAAHASAWLERLGLSIDGQLPPLSVHGVFRVTGTYRRSSWMESEPFFALQGERVLCLDNGRYTLGIVTLDADGLRTLHHLNCNLRRPQFDYAQARAAEDSGLPMDMPFRMVSPLDA